MVSLDEVKSKEWFSWGSRKINLQKACSFYLGLSESFKREMGYSYPTNVFVFDGVMTNIWSRTSDRDSVRKQLHAQLEDAEFLKGFYARVYACFDRMLKFAYSF